MHEKHHCVSVTSSEGFLLQIGHNCYSSRIAFTLTSLSQSNSFSCSQRCFFPSLPKSVYPFPYHSQPGGWVVPYLCREEWVGVSTGDPALILAAASSLLSPPCPAISKTPLSPARVDLPSPCQVFWDDLRSIAVPGYSKHFQRRPWLIQTSCSLQRTLAGKDTNTMHDRSLCVFQCVRFYSTEKWPLMPLPLSQRLSTACPVLTDALWPSLPEETPLPSSSRGHRRLLFHASRFIYYSVCLSDISTKGKVKTGFQCKLWRTRLNVQSRQGPSHPPGSPVPPDSGSV